MGKFDALTSLKPPRVNERRMMKWMEEVTLRIVGAQVFDTKETNTRQRWINGKQIYRKVINTGTLPNATTTNTAHSISDLDDIVRMYGWGYRSSTGSRIPLPFADKDSADGGVQLDVDGTNVNLSAGVNWSAYTESYVILEYTKA